VKIDVLGVQAFVAIGELHNFQKAAESLHISQTALSKRLQNLEKFLGVKLVERTTRSVGLSSTGLEFLPHARRLLTELSLALADIQETGKVQRGDVTIACVPTIAYHFLPAVIQAYATQHPNNHIRILDHSSSGVAEAVLRREAEFGINVAGAPEVKILLPPTSAAASRVPSLEHAMEPQNPVGASESVHVSPPSVEV